MRKFEPNIWIPLLALVIAGATGQAQGQSGGTETPAVQPVQLPALMALDAINAKSSTATSQTSVPDNPALAGAQNLSPDASESRRSYWQPFVDLTSTVDSNSLGLNNTFTLVPWGTFYGGTDMHWVSRVSDMSLNYLGGAVVSRYKNQDSPIQQLTLTEKLSWRHAVISLFDQFAYFPASVSAFYLPAGGNLPDNQESSVQQVFLPNQSIAASFGRELNNTFVGELDVITSQQSSLTFLESYSIVRFLQSNFFDLNDTIVQGGYNRQLTRNETIALLYRFIGFRYSNVFQPMDGHVVQLAFGRRVAGRTAFQLSAGPELALFTSASRGPSSTSPPAINRLRQLYWTLDGSITREMRRAILKFAYDHSESDGAGFLAGAITDQGYASMDGPLFRTFTGELAGGYSRNRGITASLQQPANAIYQGWFGGATLSHSLNRQASVFLSYQFQRQASNFACVGTGCGNSFIRHTLSLGVSARTRRRLIE